MKKRKRVVPAILTDDFKTLETMVHKAESFTDYVQFDIMDGQFVPSRSITCEHLAGLNAKLAWDAHLMVLHPEDYLEGFFNAGARRITFHFEATETPQLVISEIREFGLEVVLAINPETPLSAFSHLTELVDGVLFLAVHPGFYASKFIPEVLEKISEFGKTQPDVDIGIDGGIKEDNIVQVAKSGAAHICVGSAIFLQADPGASFRHLTNLIQEL